jgi:hypothetical protein
MEITGNNVTHVGLPMATKLGMSLPPETVFLM